MTELNELIARWNSDEGKPYKGSLIDMKSYEEGNLSCMCVQGQVLHVVGGWSADRLNSAEQVEADEETARLLNISRALCDMIQKYEKPPVDRKLLCAREALCWRSGYGVGSKNYAEVTSGKHDEIFDYDLTLCAHAIELWEEGFGK